MGTRAILTEMLEVIRAQTQAVIAGDHQALISGVSRHEILLSSLEQAEIDAPPEALRELYSEIAQERDKLKSLLTAELGRVDFLLRIALGGKGPGAVGYPSMGSQRPASASRFNRRV